MLALATHSVPFHVFQLDHQSWPPHGLCGICLHLKISWWPEWICLKTSPLRGAGMTIRAPLKMIPSCTLSSSAMCKNSTISGGAFCGVDHPVDNLLADGIFFSTSPWNCDSFSVELLYGALESGSTMISLKLGSWEMETSYRIIWSQKHWIWISSSSKYL